MRNTYRFTTPQGARSEETKAIRDAAASRQASKQESSRCVGRTCATTTVVVVVASDDDEQQQR